ncbi:UTP--glucose-1-phosphate uridylyltransferase AglF [Salinigranum halophilum]|jgi:glucose-1-phosphate thymidylyltransferase|uniref:UTP--glucose-1-phosphate uridylyltransferase AglF n=1 Tax=Salinigranum halophilum TaxID=2565931 RepID=UPI0010A91675|nr:UTP--glucose-1-phosphate uridylyltransferase AglF [Salinigranum halophilum]
MKAVVLAAGEGTRLRPLTETRPKALVEVDGKPILVRCLEQLADLGADGFVIVVGYRAEQVIDAIGDEFQGLPVTYTYQRERLGLAHALLTVEAHVDGEFMLMLGDNVFQANLADVVARQRSGETDAAFLVEEVPWEEASRYGVCVTDANDAIVEVVEKPAEPTSNLVMTGFYTFSPAIFHACHLVQPSARGEYELPDAIDLLIGSGRTIDAIRMDGWRTDIGYPTDREAAERRLRGLDVDGVEADRVGVEAADE